MSLFLVRSTLRGGWTVGLSIGAGIALVDALYAACGAAGAASLLAIDPLRTSLSLLGAIGTAAARRAVGDRAVRIADGVAGAGLIAFGCALATRAD